MPTGDELFVVDVAPFERALRTLDKELSNGTRRRMAAIARRERDKIRADWPGPGPAKGGHSSVAVTSGTRGLVPYLALRRRHQRFPQVGWVIFGGVRRRRYDTGVRVDRRARVTPPDGYAFYPGVRRARREAAGEVYQALQDAKRKAGL